MDRDWCPDPSLLVWHLPAGATCSGRQHRVAPAGRDQEKTAPAGELPGERFEQANARYRAGDYAGAADAYEALIAERFTAPALHHNLGNARLRLGQRGAAIAAWEQQFQKPVVTTNQAALWAMMGVMKMATPLPGLGRLLAQMPSI